MTLSSDMAKDRLCDARLYLLLTRAGCHLEPAIVLDEALAAGVDVVQVREPESEDRDLLEWVHDVRERCARHRVPVIVNDRPDVALLAGADGVHLGQNDLPPRAVRELVGEDLIVGLSTHDPEQIRAALEEPVDYIGVGPLFDTATKGLDGIGIGWLEDGLDIAPIPSFGIGGVAPENIRDVVETGVTGVAVSSAICAAREPGAMVHALRMAFDDASDDA